MPKTLTAREAWADFYKWAQTQQFWKEMPRTEKRRLYDAEADYQGTRKQRLGYARIKSILETYAPGRYKAVEGFILIEQ